MIHLNISKKHNFSFDELELSKKIITEVLRTEKVSFDVSINIEIVGKYRIRTLNKRLRNIDKTTDVLSFPNIDIKKPSDLKAVYKNKKLFSSIYDYSSKSVFLGDIVICYEKVISQSKKYNHSIKREFSFLLTHSALHLLGYDHMNEKDEKSMFKKQEMILQKLKILR